MANRHRGEVALNAGGQTYTLCLTLGALAELEDIYGGADILAIAEQFSSGALRSKDAINLLRAAIKGGGHDVSDIDIDHLVFEGGMAGLIHTLADLLRVTFSSEAPVAEGRDLNQLSSAQTGGRDDDVPFPGRRF